MKKTALTQLIEELDKVSGEPQGDKPFQEGYYYAVEYFKQKAISLLPQEREDIENSYIDGQVDVRGENKINYSQHFNEHFTQYTPQP